MKWNTNSHKIIHIGQIFVQLVDNSNYSILDEYGNIFRTFLDSDILQETKHRSIFWGSWNQKITYFSRRYSRLNEELTSLYIVNDNFSKW